LTLISFKTRLRKLEKRGGTFKPHRVDHTWELVERDLCRTFEAPFKKYLPNWYRFGEPQTSDLEIVGHYWLKNIACIVSEFIGPSSHEQLNLEVVERVSELAPLVDLIRTFNLQRRK
jgi:hypothetical protein